MANKKAQKRASEAGKTDPGGRTLVTQEFGIKQQEVRTYAEIQAALFDAATNDMCGMKDGLTYISWYNTATVLDKHAPGWEGKVIESKLVGPVHLPEYTNRNKKKFPAEDRWFVQTIYELTIHASDKSVTRHGYAEEQYGRFGGDSMSTAMARAMRKAAAYQGFARSLWYRPEEQSFGKFENDPVVSISDYQGQLKTRVESLINSNDLPKLQDFLLKATSLVESWDDANKKIGLGILKPAQDKMRQLAKEML